MRLTVFGATAVVRDPTRLPQIDHPQLELVIADAMNPDAIRPLVTGQDAVVPAVGPRTRTDASVCADGASAIITAMRTRRLIVVTASGHIVDAGDGPFTRIDLAQAILARHTISLGY